MTAAPYRGVAAWTQGTATIANGSRTVTLTNSGIITTDVASGLDYSAVRSGDFFVVDGVGYGLISEVAGTPGASTATLTLVTAWTAATQTSAAYSVIRMSMPATGEMRALMKSLLDRGGAGAPVTKLYADDSTARLLVDPHSGAPGLYVGASGASDAALIAALTCDTATGAIKFPAGVKDWALPGWANRLRNASFTINQRVVSGTVTLAAGGYGHDGVKAGSAGATYTFAASGIDTVITISAGSLILPMESALIEGGAYVLSHEGTAQARIWQGTGSTGSGSYATCSRAAPLKATGLAAATQTNVEFGVGTVLRPQFEPGAYPTAFARRPRSVEQSICERYFEKSYASQWAPGAAHPLTIGVALTLAGSSGAYAISGRFATRKSAAPTMAVYDHAGNAGKVSYFASNTWYDNGQTNGLGANGDIGWQSTGAISGALYVAFDWTASAEI